MVRLTLDTHGHPRLGFLTNQPPTTPQADLREGRELPRLNGLLHAALSALQVI